MTDEKIEKICEALKALDAEVDSVIVSQNDNAMAQCIVCFKDKETHRKVAEKLGLRPGKFSESGEVVPQD
jgi:hypothetical protein